MTVNTTTPLNEFVADGVVTDFGYDFKVLNEGDLFVFQNAIEITTGFSISGIGNDNGGTVSFDTPPPDTVLVRLERISTLERTTDFIEGGPLKASTLDLDNDRAMMAIQEVDRRTFQEGFGGSGSDTDANTLRGMAPSTAADPDTIAERDGSGNLTAVVFNGEATSARYS